MFKIPPVFTLFGGCINRYYGTTIPNSVKTGGILNMDFQRQTSRRSYEEHAATLQLLARVERVFTGRAGVYPPAAGDGNWLAFARALLSAIEVEVALHFEFEERDLFPRLEEAGDGDLAALLNEEHATIRAVAQSLVNLLRQALADGLRPQQWQTLKILALEFS